MIKSKIDYNMYLESDCIISGRKKKSLLKILIQPDFIDPIGKFMFYLRSSEYLENTNSIFLTNIIKKIVTYKFKKISFKLGFSIPINVFGPGLLIPHYGTIVVNPNAKVGCNCVLHTSVCIAGADEKIIGDNVYLSTGVILSGKITIADNITVSANSFVNKSFLESHALFGGSPAKYIKNRRSWFIEDGIKYQERIELINKLT